MHRVLFVSRGVHRNDSSPVACTKELHGSFQEEKLPAFGRSGRETLGVAVRNDGVILWLRCTSRSKNVLDSVSLKGLQEMSSSVDRSTAVLGWLPKGRSPDKRNISTAMQRLLGVDKPFSLRIRVLNMLCL